MKTIIHPLATIAGVENDKFYALIKEQNKAKHWTISPIRLDFDGGEIKHNVEQVKQIVDSIKSWSEEELQKAPLQKLKDDEQVLRDIHAWMKGSRIQATKPLDEMKKEFTAIEKELDGVIQDFKQKQEELQLLEYQERQKQLEDAITKKQEDICDIRDIDINLIELMHDWIMRKRKTQIATQKGALKKSILDEIDRFVDEAIKPILEERGQRAEQERQTKALLLDLESVECQKEPEKAIETLEKLKEQIDIKYPAIKNWAITNINANMEIARGAIQKREQEAEAAKLKEAEAQLLEDAEKQKISAMGTNHIWMLETALKNLRDIRVKAKQADTIRYIDEIGRGIKDKINTIKAEEIQKATEQKREEQTETQKHQEQPKAKIWQIDISDIEVLATMTVEAETEEKAKTEYIEKFKELLDFIDLREGE